MKRIIAIAIIIINCQIVNGQIVKLSNADARRMAIATSETLKKQNNELLKAELDKQIARTAYLPDLKGSATYLYDFKDTEMMGEKLQMRGMWMAGLSVTQPLYAGGKITAANRLADIGKDVAREQLRLQEMQTIADADQAYWNYVSVLSKIKMLEGYLRQLDAVYAQVQTAVSAEMSTESELVRIDAKRSEMQYNLQKAQNGANLCRLALCNEIGAELQTQIVPTDTIIHLDAPEQMTNDISNRPELTMLNKAAEAKRQQIKMERADMLPTLALIGYYSHYDGIKMKGSVETEAGTQPFSMTMKDDMPMAAVMLSVPLFHFGETNKKVRKARLDYENAQLDLQRGRRQLSIELQQAMQNVSDSYAMVSTAERGLADAQENLRMMQTKYDNDYCTLTDLLDAQAQWLAAKSNLIEAQAQYKINVTAWQKASGTL